MSVLRDEAVIGNIRINVRFSEPRFCSSSVIDARVIETDLLFMSSEEDFYNALFEGDVSALERLSAAKPDLPWAPDETGRDVLVTAIQWSNEASIKWVLSKNPDVSFVDDCGFSILKHVLQIEFDESANIVHKRTQDELTQLTVRLIDLLVEAGADIELTSTLGESVLHTAAMWSSPTVIRHLLNLGADPMLFDDEYTPRQPIYYAKFFKRWDAHKVLEDAMNSQAL